MENCNWCKKDYEYNPKSDSLKKVPTCSPECAWKFRYFKISKAECEQQFKRKCKYCEQEFISPFVRTRDFCSIKCNKHFGRKKLAEKEWLNKTNRDETWRNGIVTEKGYIFVRVPEHPLTNLRGYVRQHRLVVEKHLGRYLDRDETVHHIDENKSNNELSNLYLFASKGEHAGYHKRLENGTAEKLEGFK